VQSKETIIVKGRGLNVVLN